MKLTEEELGNATEALHSAQINFENMIKMMPVIKRHPLLALVRMQLKEGLKILGREVEEYD